MKVNHNDADNGAPIDDLVLSANLGFLWTEVPLCDGIGRAAAAGFTAVECHQPFAQTAEAVGSALVNAGLSMVSLNTGVGDQANGELGLAAVPGREEDARALIDQAVEYAAAINGRFVSVLSGRTGRTGDAETTFRNNLEYAAGRAADAGLGILIEPLNTGMADDYHLVHTAAAAETVRAVDAPNLRVMADTFHVMTMEGRLDSIAEHLDVIGHIQISGWPDRAEPDHGIDFAEWVPALIADGYAGAFGAEYNPKDTVEAGLAWLDTWPKGINR